MQNRQVDFNEMDFNDCNVVKSFIKQWIDSGYINEIEDERAVTSKRLTEFMLKFKNSTLTAKEKYECLNITSSQDHRSGWTFGHWISNQENRKNSLVDYFKIVEDITKDDFSIAENIVKIFERAFNRYQLIGSHIIKSKNSDEMTSYLSALKAIVTKFPSLSTRILELLSKPRNKENSTFGFSILLSKSGFNFETIHALEALMFTLRESGVSAEIMQKHYISWLTDGNRLNLTKIAYSTDSIPEAEYNELIYNYLKHDILTRDLITKMCLEVKKIKERVFKHIKTFPLKDKIAALSKVVSLDNPEDSLYIFFHVKRGVRTPSKERGLLKEINKELIASLEKQYLTSDIASEVRMEEKISIKPSAPSIESIEQHELELAMAESLRVESEKNKNIEKIEINEKQVEDLISRVDDQAAIKVEPLTPFQSIFEMLLVHPTRRDEEVADLISFEDDYLHSYAELFGAIDFKNVESNKQQEKIEVREENPPVIIVRPSYFDYQPEYEMPVELPIEYNVDQGEYDIPPVLDEIKSVEVVDQAVKEVKIKKNEPVKIEVKKTNHDPRMFGGLQKTEDVSGKVEKQEKKQVEEKKVEKKRQMVAN